VIGNVSRRDLLAYSAALLGATRILEAKGRVAKSRVSAITDEIGPTPGDAIAFAKQYGLQWVDLRNVPGSKNEYASLPAAELKEYATELVANKLKVSLLRTSLLKFPWDADDKRWARRKDDLSRAIAAAQIVGAEKIRIFTGARVKDPASAYPKIGQTLQEMLPLAENAKVRLLIENDPSQNVATPAELKTVLDLAPSKYLGFNWNPQSTEDYGVLPKNRMMNVQIAAAGLADGPQRIDWKRLLEALQKDGFQGGISVVTGPFDNSFDKPGDIVRDVMHIVGEVE
jgi:sugar phosphate isomerase/epimerase